MKPICLIVLDGWGIAPPRRGNAISNAQPKHIMNLFQENPHTLLNASGTTVGLPKGFIGNSEVGHLHLGAGRLVKQDLARIFDSIKDKSFFRNKVLVNAMNKAKQKGKALHLLGLVSDGGVHSHIQHLFGLLDLAHKFKVPNIFVHVITDGRDVPPKSALKYITQLEQKLSKCSKEWKIATVSGRYYPMDRNKRLERTQKAYEVLIGKGRTAKSAEEAVKQAYRKGETDEFILPTVIDKQGVIKNNDVIVFFNLRTDRALQIVQTILKKRKTHFVCLVEYSSGIKSPVAFMHQEIKHTLGDVISKSKLKQFRLAESEKWMHVTHFFNGLSDEKFKNESREIIPSPKVATYDKKPEMSAYAITKKAIKVFQSKKYGFVLINFANADMLGHTGDFNAATKAIKTLDECVAYTTQAALGAGFDVIITADHGNAEEMQYKDGSVCTAHSTNKVPFVIISSEQKRLRKLKNPSLYHVAPTILQLMGITKPKEMVKGLLR